MLAAGDLESAQIYRAVPLGPAVVDEMELWQIGVLAGFDLRDPTDDDFADDPELAEHLAAQKERAAKAAQVAEHRKAQRAAAREKRRSEKR